jgi:hypothetical protein
MSCVNEDDELAILPIVVFDLVSLLTFPPLFRVPGYLPSDRLVSSVDLHTRVLQGGNEFCRIEGFDLRKAVSELKVSIAAEAGLVPASTRLINPEGHVELQDHLTLEDAGMPSDQALAEGVIQLYAQKLKTGKKVVVADALQIAPGEVTDSELAVLCDSIRDDPPDILILCGCSRVTNISCLVQLSTISHLDISGCALGAKGGVCLAGVIKDMGALSMLSLKDNFLGTKEAGKVLGEMLKENSVLKELDLSDNKYYSGGWKTGGWKTDPEFAEEIAAGIKDSGALSILNLSKNSMKGSEAGKALGEALATNTVLKELDLSGESETTMTNAIANVDVAFVTAFVPGLSDNRAMTSLNLTSNSLGVEGAKIVAAFLPKCT